MSPRLNRDARYAAAILLLGLVGALCGFFGGFFQRSPSNFAPCSIIFTIPLGIFAGWLVGWISERRSMSDRQFAFFVFAAAIVSAIAFLAFIGAQQ